MLWYLRLESVKERYTKDLCELWMPDAFKKAGITYTTIEGTTTTDSIGVGSVLDAVGRPIYALTQVAALIARIGEIRDGDIIYLQDFFTPGIEGLLYALDQHNLEVRIFAMQHAGCFDQHDFTYPMKKWMGHYEIMLSKYLAGLFVASGVHKDILEAAGYTCPIHIVSLPFSLYHAETRSWAGSQILSQQRRETSKQGSVIYTSRLDPEKNPMFMLKVAEAYLESDKSRTWTITTSGDSLRASKEVLDRIESLKQAYPEQFLVKTGLTKDAYYAEMLAARTQFNSALQDFVSWTLLESTYCLCTPVYPNYRSFPEILDPKNLYFPCSVPSALEALVRSAQSETEDYSYLTQLSDQARLSLPDIMAQMSGPTFNIWDNLNK